MELHGAGLNVIPLPRVTMHEYGGKKPLLAESFTQCAVGLGRALSKFPPALLLLDIFDRSSTNMVSMPLSVEGFEKAVLDHNTGRAIIFRELALSLGSLFVVVIIPILILLGADLGVSFILAALLALVPILEMGQKSAKPVIYPSNPDTTLPPLARLDPKETEATKAY